MNNIDKIKQLRESTNLSLDLCKKALEKTNWDSEKALEELQKTGQIRAAKLSSANHEATEGQIFSYTHSGGKLCAVVEVKCQTDFCARSDEFKKFGEELAMHLAGSPNIEYLSLDLLPQDKKDKQMEIFSEQIKNNNKRIPEDRVKQILEGKMKSWATEVCLMNSESLMHQKKSIDSLRLELMAKTGENIIVSRMARWELGK